MKFAARGWDWPEALCAQLACNSPSVMTLLYCNIVAVT